MSQAVFPLSFGASWSKTTTQTTTTVFGTSSTAVSYDAAVVQEGDIVAPAGTFRAAGIQVDQFGGYEISYYSEAAGAIIRVDSYDNSDVLQGRLDLVSFKYQAGSLGLFLIGVGAIALVVLLVVVAVLASRDRKSTRLNSNHGYISYAVFCLKKKREYEVKGDVVTAGALDYKPRHTPR